MFSVIGMLGVQYTYFAAIKYGNAATATILQYMSPIIITCYLAIQTKRIPSLKEVKEIIAKAIFDQAKDGDKLANILAEKLNKLVHKFKI